MLPIVYAHMMNEELSQCKQLGLNNHHRAVPIFIKWVKNAILLLYNISTEQFSYIKISDSEMPQDGKECHELI